MTLTWLDELTRLLEFHTKKNLNRNSFLRVKKINHQLLYLKKQAHAGKIKFQYFSKMKNKNFFRNSFFQLVFDGFFLKKTWIIVGRSAFYPNLLAFLENVLNWPKWPSFLMLNLMFKVKFVYELDFFRCLILFQLQQN
jgi:hypothetical protein